MNQPQRFKEASTRAGRLMKAGSEERPPAKAMHRAAQQLGVSPSVLAAVLGPAAASAAASGVATKGQGVITAIVSKVSVSGLTAALAKGGIAGLGIGLALFAGADLIPSKAPTRTTAAAPPMPTVSAPLDVLPPPDGSSIPSTARPMAMASSIARVSSSPPRDAASVGRALSVGESESAPAARGLDEAQVPAPLNRDQIVAPIASNRSLSPVESASSAAVQENAVPVHVRLAHEVASLDRTRTLANSGNAAGALRELDAFDRQFGYSILRREATLVRIDVLLSLGRTADVAAAARSFLAMGTSDAERARLEDLLKKRGLSL